MNIKQAINIFLSVFNLSIDSDVKDNTTFDALQIFDYKGEDVGLVYSNDTANQYTIGIRSSELGIGVGHVIVGENGYDISCTFNSHMLHSPNREYDTITNRMTITLGEKVEISNSFTACKKRNVVMKFSANNTTKNMKLTFKDKTATLEDYDTKKRLKVGYINGGSVIVDSYESDSYVDYIYNAVNPGERKCGGRAANPDLNAIGRMFCVFPFTSENFTIDFDLVKSLREASSQNPTLNYFDNIFSLLLSDSKSYDERDINAIFGCISSNAPKLNGVDVIYPQDKKPAKHIEN